MFKLIITDKENNCLNFDLRDILVLILDAKQRKWTIVNMDINILPSEKIAISEDDLGFIYKINSDGSEHDITWQHLKHLSDLNIQIINGNIKGKIGSDTIEITAHDSTLWEINTADKYLTDRIKNRFKFITMEMNP